MGILNLESAVAPTVHREVAGFWRRVLAFVIDAFLTAIPCGVFGFVFYQFFMTHRADGILIGFALTLPYFAILGSSVGAGQTLGHRLTDLQVVDQQGNPISLKRSALRYSILLVPTLLSSEIVPAFASRFGINTVVDWLLSVGEFALLYLYVFNRSTRQSLHDVATKTYVVRIVPSGPVEPRRFWPWHWMILAGISLLVAAFSSGLINNISESGPFPNLVRVQKTILDSGKVQSASVAVQKNWRNGQTTVGLNVIVIWKDKPQDFEESAAQIADIVLQTDSQSAQRDFITVIFHDGFTIGFAKYSSNKPVSHSPADWRSEAQRRNPAQ
jgi:uncharacterized RDD family membrane protein YckC